jgi:plasmid stability protein
MSGKLTTVAIDKDLHRALRIAAAIRGRSIADIIREIVKDWLDREGLTDVSMGYARGTRDITRKH